MVSTRQTKSLPILLKQTIVTHVLTIGLGRKAIDRAFGPIEPTTEKVTLHTYLFFSFACECGICIYENMLKNIDFIYLKGLKIVIQWR